jgi:hypothetical protein
MREHDRRRAAGHAFLVGEPPAQRAGAIKNVWSLALSEVPRPEGLGRAVMFVPRHFR